MNKIYFILFIFIFSQINIKAQNDTISLFYDIGVYKLNEKNTKKLQIQLAKINDSLEYHVDIISSCDFLGSNSKNLELSYQRARTVRDSLLIKNNIIISSITFKGIGEIKTHSKKTGKGIIKHRKTVLVFKNQSDYIFEKMANANGGETFIVKNIVFDPSSHMLKKKSIRIIKKLQQTLQENPKLKIEISGHVCCGKNPKDTIDAYDKGTKTFNLSKNRAKHIYKYLVLKKIDSSRLTYKGYGFQKPIKFPEESAKDKLNNRRVEIKVLSN